jgi:hypothetical protein
MGDAMKFPGITISQLDGSNWNTFETAMKGAFRFMGVWNLVEGDPIQKGGTLWQYKPPLYLFRFYATLRGFIPIGVGTYTPLIYTG